MRLRLAGMGGPNGPNSQSPIVLFIRPYPNLGFLMRSRIDATFSLERPESGLIAPVFKCKVDGFAPYTIHSLLVPATILKGANHEACERPLFSRVLLSVP